MDSNVLPHHSEVTTAAQRLVPGSPRAGEGDDGAAAGNVAAPIPLTGDQRDDRLAAEVRRRQFTAAYKSKILRELDRCRHGEAAAVLRRERLQWSQIAAWRKQAEHNESVLMSQKRGRKPMLAERNTALTAQSKALRKENAALRRDLNLAKLIICFHNQKDRLTRRMRSFIDRKVMPPERIHDQATGEL